MQFSKIQNGASFTNTLVMFPLSYVSWNTVIGIGFWVSGIGALYVTPTLSGFTTRADVRSSGNFSWLALGI